MAHQVGIGKGAVARIWADHSLNPLEGRHVEGRHRPTLRVLRADAAPPPGSVAEVTRVELGGHDQVTDRVTAGALAAMWLWLGVGFHATFAAQVDPLLGAVYAALFVVQAFLLARSGLVRRELAFAAGRGVSAWVGLGALAYALVGMAPCPSPRPAT